MLVTQENLKTRNSIFGLEKRIDEMHLEFQKYHQGQTERMPEWERLERELIIFSRKKIYDLELSKHLDRILYKFQNRKKIWLRWAEEIHHIPKGEAS